jgi:hypothetical protein
MELQVNSWVEHPAFGVGQIHHDHETCWVIRFVSQGEKKIQKAFALKVCQPPSANFVFQKSGPTKSGKSTSKLSNEPTRDFKHLFERFLAKYPAGLDDDAFRTEEREYKDEAAKTFKEFLSSANLSRLLRQGSYDEIAKRSIQILGATNLVFHIQRVKFGDALKAAEAKKIFAEALFDHLYGKDSEELRFERFIEALGKIDSDNWPIATYFNFLATRGEAMFMKPTVSKRLADALGVALNYKTKPNWLTYSKLKELAAVIKVRLAESGQILHSGIDVQSFMWCIYGLSKE